MELCVGPVTALSQLVSIKAALVLLLLCSCSAQLQVPTGPPCPWLPDELWQKVLEAVPDSAHRAVLAAQLACTCMRLREALLGPGAAHLWAQLQLAPCYPGLSLARSGGVNRLLLGQACHARRVSVRGGGWEAGQLRRLFASLGDLQWLSLGSFHLPEEVAACAQAGAPQLDTLYLDGCACMPLAPRLRRLMVKMHPPPCAEGGPGEQAAAYAAAGRHQLAELAALRELRVLELQLHKWPWRQGRMPNFAARHPHLQVLRIWLSTETPHVIRSISRPPGCQLHLVVLDSGTPHFLAQLRQLRTWRLDGLQLRAAGSLTGEEEAALAQCTVIMRLVLHFSDPGRRLARLPSGGASVTYVPRHSAVK